MNNVWPDIKKEMRALIDSFPWESTSVGPKSEWSPTLRNTLDLVLDAGFPMLLLWGKDWVVFYNDAYIPVLGPNGKHPGILGKTSEVAWAESWSIVQPLFVNVYEGGETCAFENLEIPFIRNGAMEKAFWTFSYSPVRDNGVIVGILVVCQETTRSVQTQNRLEERLSLEYEELQMLYETAPVGLCLIDRNFCFTRVNARLAEINGVSAREHIGKSIYEIIPELAPQTEGLLKTIFQTGQPFINIEIKGATTAQPGVERIWNENWYPVKDDDGTTVAVSIVVEEVTEQRRAQQTLSDLANAMPQLVWIANSKGAVTFYNDQVAFYDGAHKNSDGNWVWDGLVHPEDVAKTEQRWAEAVAGGRIYAMEHRIKMKDKGYRWHLSRAYPQKDAEGVIVKWFGTATDIHEQKTLSEELEELVSERTRELMDVNNVLSEKNMQLANAEQFLQTVLDSSAEIVASFDKNLRYTFINRRGEEFIGLKAGEVLGKSLLYFFPEIVGTPTFDGIEKALNGEASYLQIKQGPPNEKLTLESYFIPYTVGGAVAGVIVLQRDVTPFIKLSENLRQSNEELRRSNSDLQQFAHVTSHDLKEPVRKINTYVSLILANHEHELTTNASRYFDRLGNAAGRISSMIDGILQYSTIDSVADSFEPIDLNKVVSMIVDDLEFVIERTAAEVIYGKLPMVRGSNTLLYQLFYNLIYNALKFIQPNRKPVIHIRSPQIPAKLKGDDAYIQVDVVDNGIGFEPEFAEKIFDSFYRLHPKDRYEGSGLGLALCRKIVSRHGGHIIANSQLNEGATFSVFLPDSSK